MSDSHSKCPSQEWKDNFFTEKEIDKHCSEGIISLQQGMTRETLEWYFTSALERGDWDLAAGRMIALSLTK